MIHVSRPAFLSFLARRPLAVPDGFKILGSYQQTRWLERDMRGLEVEVARSSSDGFGTIYEVAPAAVAAL